MFFNWQHGEQRFSESINFTRRRRNVNSTRVLFFDGEPAFIEMKNKYRKHTMLFNPDKNRGSLDPGLMEPSFETVSHTFENAKLFSDSQRRICSIPASNEISIPTELRYYYCPADEGVADFQGTHKEYNSDQSKNRSEESQGHQPSDERPSPTFNFNSIPPDYEDLTDVDA